MGKLTLSIVRVTETKSTLLLKFSSPSQVTGAVDAPELVNSISKQKSPEVATWEIGLTMISSSGAPCGPASVKTSLVPVTSSDLLSKQSAILSVFPRLL